MGTASAGGGATTMGVLEGLVKHEPAAAPVVVAAVAPACACCVRGVRSGGGHVDCLRCAASAFSLDDLFGPTPPPAAPPAVPAAAPSRGGGGGGGGGASFGLDGVFGGSAAPPTPAPVDIFSSVPSYPTMVAFDKGGYGAVAGRVQRRLCLCAAP